MHLPKAPVIDHNIASIPMPAPTQNARKANRGMWRHNVNTDPATEAASDGVAARDEADHKAPW